MRIYIEQLDLQNIKYKNILKYMIHNDNITEIYSDSGIFIFKNGKKCKKINIKDNDYFVIHNYINQYNAIIDTSMIFKSKDVISHIPYNHTYKNINRIEYKEAQESPVSFVLEIYNDNIENAYFMLTNKHAAYSEADINNPFTKESIDFFLTNIV